MPFPEYPRRRMFARHHIALTQEKANLGRAMSTPTLASIPPPVTNTICPTSGASAAMRPINPLDPAIYDTPTK
jgi:hypothetical protein